jgi:hypothetical protein
MSTLTTHPTSKEEEEEEEKGGWGVVKKLTYPG